MRDSAVEIMAYMGKLCSLVLYGFFYPYAELQQGHWYSGVAQ